MATLHYQGTDYPVSEDKTVLEILESHGHAVPNSCRSGICQSCLMKVVDGTPPAAAQKGLKDTLATQGYILSCRCKPDGDLAVTLPDAAGLQCPARVRRVRPLAERVLEVTLAPEGEFAYRPGQFLTLINEEGVARSYSIASVPALDDGVILQIALLPEGAMSTWVARPETLGAAVTLQGPSGNCFYVGGHPEQPLLLAGTGTGLAPLYGIARDALNQGHTGDIHLYHGSLRAEGLYCVSALRGLAAEHPNFHYTPCALAGPAADGISVGALDALLLERVPKLDGFRAYLCGAPEFVKLLHRKVFLAGVSMQQIFSDPFVPAARPQAN